MWLSQAFLVNKHPPRRCLCTIQHCRDRSRQFCKNLCSVLLTSQLSFKCRILSRQRIHLLLQRSHCIFHFSGTESDRTPESRVQGQRVSTDSTPQQEYLNGTETVARCLPHATSRHDHQSVPHSFRQQPTSSTHPEIRQRAPLVQQTRNKQDTGFNTAPLPCL